GEDFCRCQVTLETLLAGCAEAGIHGTTHLGGDAERAALAVGKEDAFNTDAAFHAQQELAAAVGGIPLPLNHGKCDLRDLGKLQPEVLADIAHLCEVDDAELVDPLQHLGSAKALLADAEEEVLQL